jgi:hypothetical protein
MRRTLPLLSIGTTAAALLTTFAPAQAAGHATKAKPDTSCMKAGIKTLQGARLLDDVARGGLPISTAVSLGVAPRSGTDLSKVPDPIPLSLVLADHRAGSSSLFLYPWC